jgi:hypothetical protein
MASQIPPTIAPPAVIKVAIAPKVTRQPPNRDFFTCAGFVAFADVVRYTPIRVPEGFLANWVFLTGGCCDRESWGVLIAIPVTGLCRE